MEMKAIVSQTELINKMVHESKHPSTVPSELICDVQKGLVNMHVSTEEHTTVKGGLNEASADIDKRQDLEFLYSDYGRGVRDELSRNGITQSSEDLSEISGDISTFTNESPAPLATTNSVPKTKKTDASLPKISRNKASKKSTTTNVTKQTNGSLSKIKREHSRKSACNRKIYELSDTQAMAGKQRRLEIEKASKERAAARNGEKVKHTGTISPSRAGMMYQRGVLGKKEFEARRLKEKSEQEARELKTMRNYGKISAQRSSYMYDRGMEFKKKIHQMQKELKEQREADMKKRLNPACKGKVSLDDANRTYKRLLRSKKPHIF
jgi:hypothetical protein